MASPNRCMSATGSSAATADDDDDVLCQLAPLALGDWQGRVVELREQVGWGGVVGCWVGGDGD